MAYWIWICTRVIIVHEGKEQLASTLSVVGRLSKIFLNATKQVNHICGDAVD
jgi:hypothetical protein